MNEALALLARTFLIGIAVAAPVGAMGLLCIQRVLEHGWRAGVATGLGIATADTLWAGLAAFGVASISSQVVAWQTPLQIIGGSILVVMGLTSLLAGGRAGRSAAQPGEFDQGSLYLSALGLTLTNPMTIMAFAAVFASAGLATASSAGYAVIATVGVGLGSLSWWIGLTIAVSRVHHALGEGTVTWVRRISSLVIVGFGVFAVTSAILGALATA